MQVSHKRLAARITALALLALAACSSDVAPVSGGAVTAASEPVSRSEAVSGTQPTAPTVPYASQVASITPSRRAQILEKREQNGDAIGWLTVPGTTIDEVALVNPPHDNGYYTLHNFAKEPDNNGAYGVDYRFNPSGATTRDAISRNTPLYAHNLNDDPDGILFAQLKKYKDPAFAKAHPYVFFSTVEEDMVWEVFAAYDATVDFNYIQPGVYWNVFSDLLDAVYDASVYDYGVTISEDDKVLTLSTCTFSVPGHEAMPITELNDYRFVVMARLVGPEEPIKDEAAFTVNPAPLPPDELPPFVYMIQDMFMWGGLPCNNSTYFFEESDMLEPIHYDALVPVGSIRKSRIDEPIGDREATQLPVGTVIYQDPEYEDLLVAEVGGKRIPYIAQREERALRSVRYVHQNSGGILREITLDAENVDLDAAVERFGRFVDMARFAPLPDGPDSITRGESREEIQIGAKNSLATFYQSFYLATPASLGREVMVIRQQDGYYYGDAGLFAALKDAVHALSTEK